MMFRVTNVYTLITAFTPLTTTSEVLGLKIRIKNIHGAAEDTEIARRHGAVSVSEKSVWTLRDTLSWKRVVLINSLLERKTPKFGSYNLRPHRHGVE